MASGPVLCNYYVTYRCNATCSFCDIWQQPSPLIDLRDAERNLDDLRRLGVRIIDFTGGEPLLHPQIAELLAMAKARRFITTLTTNTLLYPKRARDLAGKVDMLHFSIDSHDPAVHDASRGVRSFDSLLRSIEIAMELGERPDLLFTVRDENVGSLQPIYEQVTSPNRLILLINPLFAYNGVGGGLRDETIQQIEAFASRPFTYLNPALLALRRKGGNRVDSPDCRAVSSCIVISPFDELVLPCYHLGLERIPINGDLYERWNSEEVASHRAMEGRHAGCEGCSINCYFEPSFATNLTSSYFWQSLIPKLNYSWTKFVVQRADARFGRRVPQLPAYGKTTEPVSPSGDGSTEMLSLPVLTRRP